MNKWRRFRRLSLAERSALLQALVLLPACRVALRLFGFRRLQSLGGRDVPQERNSRGLPPAEIERAVQTARMVAAASREGLCQGNCLEQSLTVLWLLRKQGIPGKLRIGVRKEGGGLEAHAWVELGDLVLNDGADVYQRYRPFQGDLATLEADYR